MNTTVSSAYRGPSTGALGIVATALFAASLVISAIMTHGTPIPTLYTPVEDAKNYYLQFAGIIKFNTMLQFASAVPLGIFTAAITNKLQFHGARVAGVNIATFGGYAAAMFIAISALAGWVLTYPGMANDTMLLRGFQLFQFITGGVAHVVALGLLLAGVSIPSAFMKLVPKWLVWLGMTAAVFGELSTLGMFFPFAYFFIPLARFPAFVWLIGTGFSMPSKRKDMPA
ncbi:MAG TPA: hypothetical protein VG738_14155 [Chitinophagaceae bacterium]|nr:hypothetical protein [Chitinophagaceae bacterium]